MPTEINQYIKLKDVIFSYIEASKKSSADFLRLWRISFRGFKQMGLNSFWQPKTELLLVNPNLTATIPLDCIQWIRVGNFNSAGEFQVLTVNNNLTAFKDQSTDRLGRIATEVGDTENTLINSDGNFLTYINTENDNNRQQFGLGSRLLTAGECMVDVANNVIVLNTNFAYPHVALQYVSSPTLDDDYQIPLCFQEAMMAWIDWQAQQYMPSTNKGSASGKQNAANNFKNQLLLARKVFKPIRLQEIHLEAAKAEQYNVH
jgi:hypothetical protein